MFNKDEICDRATKTFILKRTHHLEITLESTCLNKNKYAACLTSDRRIRVKVGSLVTHYGSVLSSVECLGYKTNKRGFGIACSDRSKDDLRKIDRQAKGYNSRW